MKKLMALFIAACFAMTGCATVVNGSSQPLNVQGATGTQFDVKAEGMTIASGVAPTTVLVPRGRGPLQVHTKNGDSYVQEHVSGWVAGNAVSFWGLGVIVDFMDHSAYRYDDYVQAR